MYGRICGGHGGCAILFICSVVSALTLQWPTSEPPNGVNNSFSSTKHHGNDTSLQQPHATFTIVNTSPDQKGTRTTEMSSADDIKTRTSYHAVHLSTKVESTSSITSAEPTSENNVQEHTVSTDYTSVRSKYTNVPRLNVRAQNTVNHYTSIENYTHGSEISKSENESSTIEYSKTTTEYTKTSDAGTGQFPNIDVKLTMDECSAQPAISVFGKRGTITGLFGNYLNVSTERELCHWTIQIPDGFHYLYILLTMPEDPCAHRYHIRTKSAEAYASGNLPLKGAWRASCQHLHKQYFVKSRIHHFFLVDDNKHRAQTNPRFIVEFDSYTEDVRRHLLVSSESPSSGNIMQWGYDGEKNYFCINDAYHQLKVPDDHVVMVSFPRFDMSGFSQCVGEGLLLYSVLSEYRRNSTHLLAHYCGQQVIPTGVYEFSLLFHFRTETQCNYARTGFKTFYSFFHITEKPQMLKFLFNCSSAKYELFWRHLDCNMEFECLGDEDEGGHCPYSSYRCNGLVSSGHKCFQYIFSNRHTSSYAAQKECARRDGDLAMMKSKSEWNDLKKLFQYGKRFAAALFGIRSGDSSLPDLYKYMLKWFDNSVAQNVHVQTQEALLVSYHYRSEMCGVLHYGQKFHVSFEHCRRDMYLNFICQVVVQRAHRASVLFPLITFPLSVVNRTEQWLLRCADGHVTHAFLSCEVQSDCQTGGQHIHECKLPKDDGGEEYFLVSMFLCEDEATTVHYTLVCDFSPDCNDGSDETFCVHNNTCAGFLCRSGQCVDEVKRCNLVSDCFDQSDEDTCEDETGSFATYNEIPQVVRLPPPVIIDFNTEGHFTQVPLLATAACPDTHFRCADHYCLPVYLRCNGVKDCPGDEDEWQCHAHSCVGFYHCRSSMVCVHADHLCDGWPQCPHHDDEWLCHMTCPDGCLCQGRAFRCPQSASLSPFHYMRYLDASSSGMKPDQVTDLAYLVWLSLSTCGIRHIFVVRLPNLRNLDLSHNQLTSLHMYMFLALPNLNWLGLSRNLLSCFFVDLLMEHPMLQSLDLSWNLLKTFNISKIFVFANIRHLNISYNKVQTIQHAHIASSLSLRQIDLRGNPLTSYPQRLFTSLENLMHVWTDDYRLCCQQNLPDHFYTSGSCISPRIQMSSCSDLLRYGEHRILLFVVMLLCIAGNAICLPVKCYVKRNSHLSSMDVQMMHWNLMNLLMGVYISIIVGADWVYRHRYFSIRHVWTASFTCRVASLLAFVSYQATAFLVCCVTVHSLCLACPHRVRFQVTPRSSLLLCAVVWVVALTISVVPLVLTEWRFHGHTDTCLAMLTTVSDGPGKMYALALQIVLHVVLCFLAMAGQGLLHWLYYFHDIPEVSITQRCFQMTDATSASSQVLLDCARRFMFCVISVLVHGGASLPEHVHVAFGILLLPVSAALDPLLYVMSMLMARRRHRTLQRVLQRLQRQLALQKPA